MASAFLAVVAAVFCHAAVALDKEVATPGQVVQPEIVIPGEWVTDPTKQFLFLPLTIPADMPVSQLKVMTNGESLLVVCTKLPKQEPETQALRKYKLVIEALKKETEPDEKLLQSKLQTWFDTEDDDEVKTHIKAALDSLIHVRKAKDKDNHHPISVSLGMPKKSAGAASLLELSAAPIVSKPAAAANAFPSVLRGTSQHIHHHHHATRIIKESFAVEIPFPVPTEKIVMLNTKAGTMMVAMPLDRHSMEAKGISTGGKPFLRIPVFNSMGKWVSGPKAELSKLAAGLNVAAVVSQSGFEALTD